VGEQYLSDKSLICGADGIIVPSDNFWAAMKVLLKVVFLDRNIGKVESPKAEIAVISGNRASSFSSGKVTV
jgi:hypothetical protein